MYAGRSVVRIVVGPLLVIAALGVLITANLLVLPLAFLHEFSKNRIIVLGDSLGGHLDGAVTAGSLDVRTNLLNRGLQHLDTDSLVQTLAGEDIEGRSHKSDLDLVLGGVVGLGGAQGGLDGVDSIVAEASDLDIGTDLGGVGSELLADVKLKLVLHGVAVELGVIPDIGVTGGFPSDIGCPANNYPFGDGSINNIRDGELEGIVRVAVFAVQGPCDLLVESLQRGLGGLGDVAHDGVHGLALVVSLLTLDHILGRDTALRKIDISCRQL